MKGNVGGGGGQRAGLIPHQLCLAVGLVITHVISHYCFLVQRQRAAEGRQGRPFDGLDGGGASAVYLTRAAPFECFSWFLLLSPRRTGLPTAAFPPRRGRLLLPLRSSNHLVFVFLRPPWLRVSLLASPQMQMTQESDKSCMLAPA